MSCLCSPTKVANYLQRLSGPLLDCIDLQVAVQRPSAQALLAPQVGISTAQAKQKVLHAQATQLQRAGQLNGHLTGVELERHAALLKPEAALLTQAIANLNISPRGIYKVLKVARTIADLDAAAKVQKNHLLEALSYRRLDVLSQESQQI